MPSPQLPNYLKSNRKRLALFQDEVAFLLGTSSGAKVCRDERFLRVPGLETALAYEVIFNKPVRELFGGLFQEVQKEVIGRAKTLEFKLKRQGTSGLTKRKRGAIRRIIISTSDMPSHPE